jgi:nucleoid DNA-binding protein
MIPDTIIRALLENNSVTITGLGTFIVKHISSQIIKEIVYPPQTIIEFDYSKDAVGFDFVNKLSEWKQIRINKAQEEIVQWINMLEKGLEHNKTIYFDDFGTFSKDDSEKIRFQSAVNPQLNIENEGFEPVLIPSKTINIEAPVKDKLEILKRKRKKRDKILFFTVIFGTILLLCSLFLKYTIYDFYQKTFVNKKIVVDPAKEDNLDITPIIESKTENTNITDNTEPLVIEKKIESITNVPISLSEYKELYLSYQKGYYYIIAGSFVTEESALLHIKQKKLDKYGAKLIKHPQSSRIRICIGIFDNEEEANKNALLLNEKYWVLK